MALVRVLINCFSSVLHTAPKVLARQLQEFPSCHDRNYTSKDNDGPMMVLPAVSGAPYRVLYDLIEFCPLMDSSCMGFCDWKRIANEVGVS